MKSFLSRFRALVHFTLAGFDRLRFRGESRLLNHAGGVNSYLYQRRLPRRDFPGHCEHLTRTLCDQTYARAERDGVPVRYLDRGHVEKDGLALDLARTHGRTSGRLAVITALEPGTTYRLRKTADGFVEPKKEGTRCLHHYHYFLHERFGLGYVRIQTWFPFPIRIGLNGRLWLARELEKRGVDFRRHRNLLTAVADPRLAQELLDEQTRVDWPALLDEWVKPIHPLWSFLHDDARTPYYWMTEQSEWATDVVFRSPDDLAVWYPRWVRHGLETLGCRDVLRYLGKKHPDACPGDVRIDLRARPEGTRIKFWYDSNSLKFYNKDGDDRRPIALRLENTINQVSGFKVFRVKEGGDPASTPKTWQQMRKGVADLPRRAEIGQSINGRLAESLAAVADPTPLGPLLAPLGRPVVRDGRRVARAVNPLTGGDGALLRTLARGDFLVHGFRNRDLRVALHGEAGDPAEGRKQSAAVTRLLALVRGHGLIGRVPKTHRYHLTAAGRRIVTALLAAHAADVQRLTAA